MDPLPDYLPLRDDSASEEEYDRGYEPGGARLEDPLRTSRRRRYFTHILEERARQRADREREGERPRPSASSPTGGGGGSSSSGGILYTGVRDDAKEEDVEEEAVDYGPIEWRVPAGFDSPDTRLSLLEREVYMWCGGKGCLNVDNLKAESKQFVDGELDASFEEVLGRCVRAEAKAAKRRAKRHRKKYYKQLIEDEIRAKEDAAAAEGVGDELNNDTVEEPKEEPMLAEVLDYEERMLAVVHDGAEKGADGGPMEGDGVLLKEEDCMEWTTPEISEGSNEGELSACI